MVNDAFLLDEAMRGGWGRARGELIEQVMMKVCPFDGRILDVGCGTGVNTLRLLPFGTVWAIEPVEELVSLARSNGLVVERGSAEKYPLKLRKDFGVITMFDVLEHCENDVEALREARRHLASDGKVFLTVPGLASLYSDFDVGWEHYRRYSQRQLSFVAGRAGFKVVHMSGWNYLLWPVSWLLRFVVRYDDVKAASGVGGKVLCGVLRVENWLRKHGFFGRWGLSIVCVLEKDGRVLL